MKLLKLFYEMYLIRSIEKKISLEYSKGNMRCPVHLSIGQEAKLVEYNIQYISNETITNSDSVETKAIITNEVNKNERIRKERIDKANLKS